jgi:hypothetical protein
MFIVKMIPPNVYEIIVERYPDGAQWYEIRTLFGLIAFKVTDYDDAILNLKCMRRHGPKLVEMYYVWTEDGELHEERIY